MLLYIISNYLSIIRCGTCIDCKSYGTDVQFEYVASEWKRELKIHLTDFDIADFPNKKFQLFRGFFHISSPLFDRRNKRVLLNTAICSISFFNSLALLVIYLYSVYFFCLKRLARVLVIF